jgi:hypothetical protein
LVSGNYQVYPTGGAYPGPISNLIQSGQAFFIKGGSGGGSISFAETSKDGSSALVNGTFIQSPAAQLSVNLLAKIPGDSSVLLDGAGAIFDEGYSAGVDEQDASKIMNGGENIYFSRNGSSLTVERRPMPVITDTLNLNISGMKQQSYTWQFDKVPGVTAFLLDKYAGSYTAISPSGTAVDFTIDATPASYAAGRFKIVFDIAAGPLPVTLTSIAAVRNTDKTITVSWKTENEINLSGYTVERSGNGNSFTLLGLQAATDNNGGSGSYVYKDANPLSTDNYYRIKALSKDGKIQYSPIAKVSAANLTTSISVYPNPVVDKTLNIHFANQPVGRYQIQLVNQLGQIVYKGIADINNNNETKSVILGKAMASGNYKLLVVSGDGKLSVVEVGL